MMRQFLSIGLAVLIPLFTLEECDRSLVPALPNGGGYSAPANQPVPASPMPPPVATTPMPMLDDPEAKTETWNEYIQAGSIEQAENICQDKANRYSETRGVVRFVNVRKTSKNPKYRQYECIFETEVSEPSTDDRRN